MKLNSWQLRRDHNVSDAGRRCGVSAGACIPTGSGTGRCSCSSMPAKALQLALGANVFSPSVLAITHGHSDHVLGLPGLIAARRFGKGAVDKPLTIVFPEGSRGVQAVRELSRHARMHGVVFPLTWIAAHARHVACRSARTGSSKRSPSATPPTNPRSAIASSRRAGG